ncbi:hypothetical protein DV702_15470 [Sporosarcina sp. PTS2304]|uniref:PepSY domain-containing protein n=1 Tax=Sporosarcina sp. PTS2304 TaxID=2283194 RepID=UPI000E0DFF54|nr:PepSY domain-containing protein [Sporosarcina sp. PTS2304]AXI00988.1 hypothetical protein DV702_15470 [Sporosarcina sp. PTS2304]
MGWLKKPLVLTVIIAIVVVAGGNWYIKQMTQEETVPIEEVKMRLESMYQGSVEQLTDADVEYQAEILRNGALYSATVDRKTGKVKTLELLKKAEPTVVVKSEPEKPIEKPANEPVEEPVTPNEKLPVIEKPASQPVSEKPIEKPRPQPVPAPIEKPKPQPQEKKQSVVLTEQQAIAIALGRLHAKVPVEVDDVDFVPTQQGGYYLVELDLDTDAELDEVVYQIHAISGKIMSESWDD